MPKSKEQLLAYSYKILSRGDQWKDVIRYLDRQDTPQEMRQAIIDELRELESHQLIPPEQDHPPQGLDLQLLLSLVFIGGGLILFAFLWGQGFLSAIPFIIIALGITGLLKRN